MIPIINESLRKNLNEDKVVKFDGEMFPKFGWCVILMGGAASGKGTAFSQKIAIQGDYYNPDNLKEIERMWKIHKYTVDPETGKRNIPTGETYEDTFETPSTIVPQLDNNGNQVYDAQGNPITYDLYRNMKNRDFVSELHNKMDDLSTRWKHHTAEKADEYDAKGHGYASDRLPNIIFDITGKKYKSVIDDIVKVVKPQGYKVAIVWMLTEAGLAIQNNEGRPRSVSTEILVDSHLKVMDTAEGIFNSPAIHEIDEFWVIDTATKDTPIYIPDPQRPGKTKLDVKAYHDLSNVYQIPCEPGGLQKFEWIVDRLAWNRSKFNRELDKNINIKKD